MFEPLPLDVQHLILLHLDSYFLIKNAYLIQSDRFWKLLFERDFKESIMVDNYETEYRTVLHYNNKQRAAYAKKNKMKKFAQHIILSNKLLHFACLPLKILDFDVVINIINQGADINIRNEYYETPLIVASAFRNTVYMELLILYGANYKLKTKEKNTIFHKAATHNNIEIVKLLVDMGVNLNKKNIYGDTALFHAALSSNIEIINLLLQKGADVTIINNNGESLLTSGRYSLSVIEIFIHQKLDINHQNIHGETLLMHVARRGSLDIVLYLLEKGADVNKVTRDGYTAFMMTATYNSSYHETDKNILQALLTYGSNVNHQNIYGDTTLMILSRKNKIRSIEYLLKAGADRHIINKLGNTALDYAIRSNYTDLTNLLS